MAELFFSEARAGLILIDWKDNMAGSFSSEQPARANQSKELIIPYPSKGAKNGHQNDPKMIQNWIHFGSPKSAKTIVFPCVFAWNGGPKGPRFWPQNELGNEPKLDPKFDEI